MKRIFSMIGPPKPFLPGVDSLALQAEEMIDTLKDGEHHLLPGDVSLLRGAEAEKEAERSIENLVPVVHALLPVLIDLAKALLKENEDCEKKKD